MTAPILRALLLVLQASHRAFANCDRSVIHEGYCLRPEDYAALNVALVRLASRLPIPGGGASLTLRAEIALDSLLASLEDPVGGQVHPDSALPSRTEFDTTEAQYGALASMRDAATQAAALAVLRGHAAKGADLRELDAVEIETLRARVANEVKNGR